MNPSLYTMSVETFVPMLQNLSAVLEKGAAHARNANIPEDALVDARLAPDMFPLSMQVQIACDHAKGTAARLTGNQPPRFADNEKTFEELKTRIAKTIDYLTSLPAKSFAGAEERRIVIPLQNNTLVLEANGAQLVKDWALPNFYFHVTTAYDILRHKGVEIGKRDFLGHTASLIRPQN